MGFLIAGGQLFHSILDSLFMFAGLHAGAATYGYLDWLVQFSWAALGNMVGGIALVTVLRVVQSRRRIVRQRRQPDSS